MDIGDSPIFRFEFRNRAGDLADPTIVTAWVEPPTGAVIPLVPTHVSLGVYEVTFDITLAGDHWVRVKGTGGINAAKQKKFNVTEQKAVAP